MLNTEGPLLIVAGAGAGKTKTITHRIAHQMARGVPPFRILAVTFTNKAAGEMRERVMRLLESDPSLRQAQGKPLVTTFHSLGVRILREFHEEAGLPRAFVIWDRDDSIKAIKRIQDGVGDRSLAPRAILGAISREKGNGVTLQEYEKAASSFRERSLAELWRHYEAAVAEEDALDFDDLLIRTLLILQTRPEVLTKLQDRFTHITVDEYQDTNRAQYEIVRHLAGERKNICVVGDGDQNIYSWRGAEMAHLLGFEKAFPGASVVLLEQNYRSTRTILAAANAVIAKNTYRHPKNLFTDNETGEPIGIFAARNEIEEAWFVAYSAKTLIKTGVRASEIAALYRENFQSRALEEALLHLNVPYRLIGTRFFERKEVKDTLSYLRAALNPKSKTDLSRIITVPSRGIGKTTLQKILDGQEASLTAGVRAKVEAFRMLLGKIRHAAETIPCSETVRFALEVSGMEAMFKDDAEEGKERLDNVRELVNLATRYDDLPPREGVEKLLEEAALQSDQDELSEEVDAMSLMTVHASKGLEFDVVFVTGLEQGLFPAIRADTRDPEEERRLFYVAMTRARKKLYLTFAQERSKWGKREYTTPSEFLDDIDPRLAQYEQMGTPDEPVVE